MLWRLLCGAPDAVRLGLGAVALPGDSTRDAESHIARLYPPVTASPRV